MKKRPQGPPAVRYVLRSLAHAAYQRPDGVFAVPVTALRHEIGPGALVSLVYGTSIAVI